MPDESVSIWIEQLKAGYEHAAQKLWERYLERLTHLASLRLRSSPNRLTDQEDVVLQTFEQFCVGARHGKFPKLDDRKDLWQVLVVIAERRAIDLMRKEMTYRKHVAGESVIFADGTSTSNTPAIQRVADREPTPAEAAAIAEECVALLARLQSDELRAVARWRMTGLTNDEIAKRLECSLRSVERMLQQIRECWGNPHNAQSSTEPAK